jgi:hypothetical protein
MLPPLLDVIASEWLDIDSLMQFDMALMNTPESIQFVDVISSPLVWKCLYSRLSTRLSFTKKELRWLGHRSIQLQAVCLDSFESNELRVLLSVCRLQTLSTVIVVSNVLSATTYRCISTISDETITLLCLSHTLKILKLTTMNVRITDESMRKLYTLYYYNHNTNYYYYL